MNEKQGEHLDQCIRQSLAGLPDSPPPGSPFDSARLWEQLRPELSAPPVARKRVGGWWLAAASAVGLLVGMWWFQPSLFDNQAARRGRALSQTTLSNPVNKRLVRTQTEHRTKSLSSVVPENQAHTGQHNWPDSTTEYHSIVQTSQSVVPESKSLSPAISTTESTVTIAPKRRFRVVHENELPAEDEAYWVRYPPEGRTERFVRLGTGNPSQPTASDDLPALQLPLNRKTPQ